MTTPKPEATMPEIAEALAEEIDEIVLQALLAASTPKVAGLPFVDRCKARSEISRIATDRILSALRADPTAGAQGTGAPLTGTGSREPRPEVSASGFDPSRIERAAQAIYDLAPIGVAGKAVSWPDLCASDISDWRWLADLKRQQARNALAGGAHDPLWLPIDTYPREPVQFGPTPADTTEWGPEAVLLMPACEEYPNGPVAVTGHLEADEWLSRDAGDPAAWGNLAAPPLAWMPLPAASATEAGTAETGTGSVHEGAAGNAGTPDPSPLHPHAEGNGHA